MLTCGINNRTTLTINRKTPIVTKQKRKIARPKMNLKKPSELSIFLLGVREALTSLPLDYQYYKTPCRRSVNLGI